jgi:hypothetical protein
MRGENGGAQETFAVDCVQCEDFLYRDSVATTDDGGHTASGFTANYSNRGYVERCMALEYVKRSGFTYYSSQSIQTTDCYAGDNAVTGINNEECWDLNYVNCNSGNETTRLDITRAPVVFTAGATHPNNVGFVCLFNHGGGRISYANCNSRGNTSSGFRVSGSLSMVTTAGDDRDNGGATTTATAAMYQTMIGRYVQVGTGRAWVKVVTVSGTGASATFTTDAAHGGTSGDTVLVLGGEVEWKGGFISGNHNGSNNGSGFQPVDLWPTCSSSRSERST